MKNDAPPTDESATSRDLIIVGSLLPLDLTGYFTDLSLGTTPWFLLSGYSVGLGLVLYAVITADRAIRHREGAQPV